MDQINHASWRHWRSQDNRYITLQTALSGALIVERLQRESRTQLSPPPDTEQGENLWRYLDDTQHAALSSKLKGGH